MAKKSTSKRILKDILIVGIGIAVIYAGILVAFGTPNPFYVVASGSMIPVLEVNDVIIVQGGIPFEEIKIGDIIVFDRPKDHDRVIVHRVASILDDDPKTIRTKGDANPASIPGTDFPITEEEYRGKVVFTISQVGYITKILAPPINYVLIVIVVGALILSEMRKRKKEKEVSSDFLEYTEIENKEPPEELDDINKIEKDAEYSEIESPEIKEQEPPEEVNDAKEDSENKLDKTNKDFDEKSENAKK